MFEMFARDVHVSFEFVADDAGLVDEHLPERGHDFTRRLAGHVTVDGHVAPTQHRETFVEEYLLDRAGGAVDVVDGEESDAGGVGARDRKFERHHRAVERVGDLDGHAGAVAGVGFRAGCASVVEAAHGGERLGEDRVGFATLHVDDESDAAAVVFEPRVVQALGARKIRVRVVDCAAVVFGHVNVVLRFGRSVPR